MDNSTAVFVLQVDNSGFRTIFNRNLPAQPSTRRQKCCSTYSQAYRGMPKQAVSLSARNHRECHDSAAEKTARPASVPGASAADAAGCGGHPAAASERRRALPEVGENPAGRGDRAVSGRRNLRPGIPGNADWAVSAARSGPAAAGGVHARGRRQRLLRRAGTGS